MVNPEQLIVLALEPVVGQIPPHPHPQFRPSWPPSHRRFFELGVAHASTHVSSRNKLGEYPAGVRCG